MILSTPHPPPSTEKMAASLIPPGLFTVKSGIPAEDALVAVAEYLSCASAIAYEVADNHTAEFRPLARSVIHQVDTARLLVEAMLIALNEESMT